RPLEYSRGRLTKKDPARPWEDFAPTCGPHSHKSFGRSADGREVWPIMSELPSAAALQPKPRPTILELFIAFSIISLSGFGGVLYWSRRMLVEQRKWM